MKIVIDIPEELYKECQGDVYFPDTGGELWQAVKNGISLDDLRTEIEQKIEQERFARSVFRGEEKDAVKAEQCTGSIMAYNNVIKFIDKYKTESEE